MRSRFVFQIILFGLLLLIFISSVTAFAANMTIAESNVGHNSIMVTANDLKPNACSSLNLTNIVSGSGVITGTDGNDLIIGGSSNDTVNGRGGDDCILGGIGDDTIDGGDGTDICIGGAGADSFSTCETEIQ